MWGAGGGGVRVYYGMARRWVVAPVTRARARRGRGQWLPERRGGGGCPGDLGRRVAVVEGGLELVEVIMGCPWGGGACAVGFPGRCFGPFKRRRRSRSHFPPFGRGEEEPERE